MGKVSPFYGTHSDRTLIGALRSGVSTSRCLGKAMLGVSLTPTADVVQGSDSLGLRPQSCATRCATRMTLPRENCDVDCDVTPSIYRD